jgi:hypothetical protein
LIGPATPLPAVLAMYLLMGVFLGFVNPPITVAAVSGMPRSMAGLASSLASTGRQVGTTLGVAVSGTIIGPELAHGGTAFTTAVSLTSAAHGVWWMIVALGAGIVVLGAVSSSPWARRTAERTAVRAAESTAGRTA